VVGVLPNWYLCKYLGHKLNGLNLTLGGTQVQIVQAFSITIVALRKIVYHRFRAQEESPWK